MRHRENKTSERFESGLMMGGHDGEKTKVVIRHLPPALARATFMEKVDTAFAGRYNWVSFRPGKIGQKGQSYCRAYIDFKRPDDVIAFADFFNGHVFVNEKGSQFKAVVEYAPSQRVPKMWFKNDSREGTIHKDPEYLEFLELISKPVENLPSAEIQLERREAERSGFHKDGPIVTPLMDFVRQKRAARNESRRILSNGKLNRRSGASGSPGSSILLKRSAEKKRLPTTMYVMRDSAKGPTGKERPANAVNAKLDDRKFADKAVPYEPSTGVEVFGDERAPLATSDSVKKKILLVKGKEKEILTGQRQEFSGKISRTILLNKDNDRSTGSLSDQAPHNVIPEKEKRPPRPPVIFKDANGIYEDRNFGNDSHPMHNDKQEKRSRNRDRSDRVVWTPLRRSDGIFSSDESVSSHSVPSAPETSQEMPVRTGDIKTLAGGRGSPSLSDNGPHKQFGRRSTHFHKDSDGPYVEGKPPKRSGNTGFEKQVWVQKSTSG